MTTTPTAHDSLSVPGPATEPPHATSVDERLRSVGRDVRRAMLDAVPDAEPHDWLYRLVRVVPEPPRQGDPAGAVPGHLPSVRGSRRRTPCRSAVAIEMLHNAFLVHDDIADGSELPAGTADAARRARPGAGAQRRRRTRGPGHQVLRRHTPAVSTPTSANACSTSSTRWRCAPSRARRPSSAGAATRWSDLAPEDYLDLIMHKTCWYTTIHPLRVGALLGSGGRADLRPDGAVRLPPGRRVPDPGRPAQPGGRRGASTARRSTATSARASARSC